MQILDTTGWVLVGGGALVMGGIVLRSIGQGAVVLASDMVDYRRTEVAQRKQANAEAESAGRAASLEPLALNADGTIEEPIIGEVETT